MYKYYVYVRGTYEYKKYNNTFPIVPKPFGTEAGHAEYTPVNKDPKFCDIIPGW